MRNACYTGRFLSKSSRPLHTVACVENFFAEITTLSSSEVMELRLLIVVPRPVTKNPTAKSDSSPSKELRGDSWTEFMPIPGAQFAFRPLLGGCLLRTQPQLEQSRSPLKSFPALSPFAAPRLFTSPLTLRREQKAVLAFHRGSAPKFGPIRNSNREGEHE
jgi:hypothetical protein